MIYIAPIAISQQLLLSPFRVLRDRTQVKEGDMVTFCFLLMSFYSVSYSIGFRT